MQQETKETVARSKKSILSFSYLATLPFFLLLTAGFFFRLRQYLFNRSLWLDEAMLGNNIVKRDLVSLLTQPLAENQGAPAGFLALSKFFISVLGSGELVLRLLPLLAGLASLYFGYRLSLLVFRTTSAQLCFVGLLAFCPSLIYYSTELKQYSVDVAAALFLLWQTLRILEQGKGYRALALGGALALWFSHASILVLSAIGLVLLVKSWRNKDRKVCQTVFACILIWLLSFSLHFLLSMHLLVSNEALLRFWKLGYAPFPPNSLAELSWYLEAILGLVYLSFFQRARLGLYTLPDWFGLPNLIISLFLLAGAVVLFRKKRNLALILFLCIVCTMMASVIHLYPFRNRLVLFLVPTVFLAVASLVEAIQSYPKEGTVAFRYGAAALAVIFLALVFIPTLTMARSPYNVGDVKSALSYVAQNQQRGDAMAIAFGSTRVFKYYSNRYNFRRMPLVAANFEFRNLRPDEAERFIAKIRKHRELERVWVLINHRFELRSPFLAKLSTLAPLVSSWEGSAAGAYLFDLR